MPRDISSLPQKYYIKTFGCQANVSDSERIASMLEEQGMQKSRSIRQADYIVINTCIVRESAENRIYGLINKLSSLKKRHSSPKIVLTGCMVGLAIKDKSGRYLKRLQRIMPEVDEFLPIEEVSFDYKPLRSDPNHAWVPISNGCNNYCSYCVVPYTRGSEISRLPGKIISECQSLANQGYRSLTLVGQNVNSYGSDLILQRSDKVTALGELSNSKPVMVKHLGKYRIPTLFPQLLERITQIPQFKKIGFISSNPWDFSKELISVIAGIPRIDRTIHLPVQSGDDMILKRMNRWYTAAEYLALINEIRSKIPDVQFTTDIIVGFPDESENQFQNTVDLVNKVGFTKAYIAMYSPRPLTQANKEYPDNIPHRVKRQRWNILNDLINK